ncbi:hypothetical protein H6P1_00611 (plasmid) [Variovorax sp. PBL-H6]|nr:hypothetical protein SRS16P1_00318 [Variovorax sp. SRS16]VTU42659.1 hypothetical protein E5P1_00316 [Variovorax sp. PBL-E5]VTU43875.1 hypothetical protein H6P1_00611 [Variovorax sp. PBL-H6]
MKSMAPPSPPHQLHLSGPGLSRYELGEPMFVYEGARLLGTVEPVEASPDRSEVRVGRFVPSPSSRREVRNFAPLLLAEVTMFLAERFPAIQAVHFALSRELEMHGDGLMVAAARVEFLRSIGATDIEARPRPDASRPGNFVVHGVWAYTEENISSLRMVLAMERELYRKHLAYAAKQGGLAALLGRLKDRWARGDDPSRYPFVVGSQARSWRWQSHC